MTDTSLQNPYNDKIVETGTPIFEKYETAVFVPKYNSGGKRDATGAFQPEARRFVNYHALDTEVVEINNKESRLDVAEELIAQMAICGSEGTCQVWVFFCHGYTHGIQFGIRSPEHPRATERDRVNYGRFVFWIAQHVAPTVILYACSTGDDPDGDPDTAPGSGDDSFGDALRDSLCKVGCTFCRVVSHTTSGHTTRNPYAKLFDGNGSRLGGHGGNLIVKPGTDEFRVFKRLLRQDEKSNSFRFRFPFMELKDIHEEIRDNL